MSDIYAQRGYGAHAQGFGTKPAVVVVDFQRGFIDPAFPMGGAPMVDAAVERTVGTDRGGEARRPAGDRLCQRLLQPSGGAALEGAAGV